jgi:hypothetical protein
VIRIERSWDEKEGSQGVKTEESERTVPIPSVLRGYLVEQRIRASDPEGLVFGTGSVTFSPAWLRSRALTAWKRDRLEPITLHEARHTFASLMIAAGVNAKAISSYMGPLEHPDHLRHLRTPDAGKRGRGGRAARRLPRPRCQGRKTVTPHALRQKP